MQLRGQAENGYAMAALLVAMSIMAVMMTVAMPVWRQASTREKEAELVFRGEQYAHAIGLFKRKFGNASPPSIDLLVDQRFLRRKFKDPITNDDFQPLTEATPQAGAPGTQPGPAGSAGSTPSGIGVGLTPSPTPTAGRGAGPAAAGGIIGVTSKSKDKSLRLYKGRGHYNEWAFVFTQQTQAPGVGAPGTVAPGQRGQPQPPGTGPFGPGGPGGRGQGRGQRQGQPPNQPGSREFTVGPDGRLVPINPAQPPPNGPSRGRGPGGD